MLHDLIDCCAPGQEVTVSGELRQAADHNLNRQYGFPVFSTVIVANNVASSSTGDVSFSITTADEAELKRLSQQPNIARLIVNSIAPSLFGLEHVKMCIAMSLFGGVAKEFENGHRIRGDINCLLLGDPGVAKSQLLKFAEKTSQRAVYTTGKGASAVGLTASVRLDSVTREWTLEGGALVLADQGICLIDEFDKMSDQDRTSIHEAMEQQTISVAKANIHCTLKARCAVIAAANPVSGRYNNTQTFQEQVDLTEPILSRFDALCVLRDVVDREADGRLASFVLDAHDRASAGAAEAKDGSALMTDSAEALEAERRELESKEQLSQDQLRKYIAFARRTVRPRLDSIDTDKIVKLYRDMRKEAETSGGVKVTLRQVESIIRMSEAHAKMHLRGIVTDEDVDVAIRTMLTCFISTQKLSVKAAFERRFASFITKGRDKDRLLLDALEADLRVALQIRMVATGLDERRARETPVEIKAQAFQAHVLQELGISGGVSDFYRSDLFKSAGCTYEQRRGGAVIVKRFEQ